MRKFLLISLIGLSLAVACRKSDDKPNDKKDEIPSQNLTPEATPTPAPNSENAGEEQHNEEATHNFTEADLQAVSLKGIAKFKKVAAEGEVLVRYKVWKTNKHVWVRVVTKKADATEESSIFLACHPHGDTLGCHTKNATDPSEPADTATPSPAPDTLPDID